MMRSRDGHTGAGKTWLARATVLALGAATLTVPLGIMTGAEAARLQPRTTSPTSTLAVIKTINVGNYPQGVAINDEDDTVYVTNEMDNNVSVINGRTGTVSGSPITVGNRPFGAAVDQTDDTVYVTNQGSSGTNSTVSVIDGRNPAVSSTVTVGRTPKGVAVDQSDDTVYVVNYTSNTVSVINGRNPSAAPNTISVGAAPEGVAVNSLDDTVYVANFQPLGTGSVSVINGRTTDDSRTITAGNNPISVAVDQVDDTIYVVNAVSANVSVINGRTTDDSRTITVGSSPRGIAVDQNDDIVYVANYGVNTVSVINGRTGQRTDDTVTVGNGPRALAVDDSGTNAGLVYVVNQDTDNASVIGRVTPTLASPSGAAGSTATITVTVPNLASDFAMDDSTITSVTFGTTVFTTGTGLTAASGNSWTFTVPAGSGTVPVTVNFNGSSATVSAGSFTYNSTPTPTPTPPPPAPTYPPGPPTGVTGVAGDDTALVTWTPPTNTGAGPITSYYVYSNPRTGSCTATPPATSCVMTGLTNGTTYTFQVQAINIDGASSPSAPSNEVTPGVTPPPPPPPPTPTITITGTRDDKRIVVTGTATELAGKTLRPWIRFPGQTSYTEGLAVITPSADGSFSWQRKTGKKTTVYIAHETTKSNTVIIPAR